MDVGRKVIDEEQKEAGRRLKKIRLGLGYTQEQFAEILEVSVSTYKKMENGESGITVKRLRLLNSRLGVSVDHLLFGDKRDFSGTWMEVQNLGENDKLFMFLRLRDYLKEKCADMSARQEELETADEQIQEIMKLF